MAPGSCSSVSDVAPAGAGCEPCSATVCSNSVSSGDSTAVLVGVAAGDRGDGASDDAEGVRDRVTYLGVDERTHEMCNQYLVATQGLRLDCGMERCACQSHS